MFSPELHKLLVRERIAEIHRRAARLAEQPGPPLPLRAPARDEWVTLRFAFPDDDEALARLASLDGAVPPAAPVLVAEVGGALRAALSLADGRAVADPFHPSCALLELLRARARQLEGAATRWPFRRRGRVRARPRLAGWR